MAGSSVYSTTPRPAPRTQVRLWDGRWWPCAGRYAGRPVFRYGWAQLWSTSGCTLGTTRVKSSDE